MAEKSNRKYDKRLIFPVGKQRDFLIKSRQALGISWPEIAKIAKVHNRTICDWRREKYSIQYKAAKKIELLSKVNLPKDIEIKDPFWYSVKGSDLGWRVVLKRYGCVGGDPEYRKKKWFEWWEKDSKNFTHDSGNRFSLAPEITLFKKSSLKYEPPNCSGLCA